MTNKVKSCVKMFQNFEQMLCKFLEMKRNAKISS